jgi:hypothetical protein
MEPNQPGLKKLLFYATVHMLLLSAIYMVIAIVALKGVGNDALSGLSGLALGLVLLYISRVAAFVVVPVIMALLLRRAGYRRPFVLAFVAGIMAASGASLLQALPDNTPRLLALPLIFIIVALSYAIGLYVASGRRVWTRLAPVVGMGVLLALGGSVVSAFLYESGEKAKYNQAVADLGYEVFAPGYIPAGAEYSRGSLNRALASNEYSIYQKIGKVGLIQGRYHDEYSQIVDPPQKCDGYGLYNAIQGGGKREVSNYRPISKGPCQLLATTPKGYKLYAQPALVSGDRYIYVRINQTALVFEFSQRSGSKYQDSFLPELVKVVDSLEPVKPEELMKS